MIVFGPRDADLGGAPVHWREGNWRPDTRGRASDSCAFPTIPFDKCDVVMEYDARRPEQPMPTDQGWGLKTEGSDIWRHDPRHGVLRFVPEGSTPSFWEQSAGVDGPPGRGAAHGLFLIDDGARELQEGGLDFLFEAPSPEGSTRGMRGCWSSRWHWRALDGSDAFPFAENAAEPTITRVWHGFGMDAELFGTELDRDGVEADDGGRTIGSLDDLIANDERHRFGYADAGAPRAVFGMTERDTRLGGAIRHFAAAFPGRFLRPQFRATALAEVTWLRLLFCRAPDESDEAAALVVHYTAPSLGMRENALPGIAAPTAFVKFDPSRPEALVEVAVPLEGLVPGEPLRFTVERDWRDGDDRLRATVHLIALILDEQGER